MSSKFGRCGKADGLEGPRLGVSGGYIELGFDCFIDTYPNLATFLVIFALPVTELMILCCWEFFPRNGEVPILRPSSDLHKFKYPGWGGDMLISLTGIGVGAREFMRLSPSPNIESRKSEASKR